MNRGVITNGSILCWAAREKNMFFVSQSRSRILKVSVSEGVVYSFFNALATENDNLPLNKTKWRL